jgi:MFS family permease
MEEDLGLVGDQFQIAVSVLFITYCLFEVPSNMIIKRLQPARFLGGLALCWGIVATCSALVQDFGGLVACRLLLGLFEAGMFPGIILYLGMFYNRNSIALRVSYFFSIAAVSGAAGGLVAYACGSLDGVMGWKAWRWVLFVNGLPSIATGLVIPFILPNSVESARFLSAEKKSQLNTLRYAEVGQSLSGQELHKSDVMKGVKDWTTYAFAFCGFCNNIMLYSFSTFLPTIILGIGTWTRPQVQALTIPVYALGAIAFLIMGKVADKTGLRAPLVVPFLCTAILGYILLLANINLGASFAGCFLIGIGLYTAAGLPLTWLTSNCPRYGKRAWASGVQLTIANMAGVPAPFIFASATAPRFIQGYATTIAALTAGACTFTGLALYWRHKNRQREAGKED